jgi:replicative DNA helicase
MQEVAARGTLDAVTLGAELVRLQLLEKIGGATVIAGLTDLVATSTAVDSYVRIVRQAAATRRIIFAAQDIAARGFGGLDDPEDFAVQARTAIVDASRLAIDYHGARLMDDGLLPIVRDVMDGKPPGALPTGFRTIDHITGGLWPGLVTIVSGRPGMGKSVLSLHIALNVARAGGKVLFFALEDAREFVQRRALAALGNLHMMRLTLNRIDRDEYPRLLEAMRLLDHLPLWIIERGLTSEQIRQYALAHKAEHGLDLVVIDHVGLVMDKGEEYEVLTQASRTLVALAKETGVPVVVCSQLNRKLEDRMDKRPREGDLRGSGHLEEDARAVWFCYRPGKYKPNDESIRNEFELIVAKASHGPTGYVKLWCDLARMTIRDVLEPGEPEAERPRGGNDY